jgi:hypothetical protein
MSHCKARPPSIVKVAIAFRRDKTTGPIKRAGVQALAAFFRLPPREPLLGRAHKMFRS